MSSEELKKNWSADTTASPPLQVGFRGDLEGPRDLGGSPRISVIMGIYNCAATLVEALDSLYAQTYQGFKVILCDDGSTDDTYQVAADYAAHHDNIILIRNERNMGLNYTLNHCLEYADTEYVARMDGDDISLPDRFEKEIRFLDQHPEYAVVSGPMIYFDENGDFRQGHPVEYPQIRTFIKSTPHPHAPCMIRTLVMEEVGGYTVEKRFLRIEDYNLWTKIYAAGYRGYNLQDPIYKMRDDRNAAKRRTFQARWNSTRARLYAYRRLGISLKDYPKAFLPTLIGLLPNSLYNYLRKQKYGNL